MLYVTNVRRDQPPYSIKRTHSIEADAHAFYEEYARDEHTLDITTYVQPDREER